MAIGQHPMGLSPLCQIQAIGSQGRQTSSPNSRAIFPMQITQLRREITFCCMEWGVLERLRFAWSFFWVKFKSIGAEPHVRPYNSKCLKFIEEMSGWWVSPKRQIQPSILKFWLPSVSLLFSGLMLPQLAPSHRDLRVFVIFLLPSLVDWMAHLNLLFTGLACWKKTM